MGPHENGTTSYKAAAVMATKFVGVVRSATAGEAALPAAAGDSENFLGIIQATADAVGEAVETRYGGSSFLKVSEAVAVGDYLTLDTAAGKEGWGKKIAEPAAVSDPPTKAEVDAIQEFNKRKVARAEQASTASGDIIVARLLPQ